MQIKSESHFAARQKLLATSVSDIASKLVRAAAPVVDAGLQKLSKVDGSLPKPEIGKTNPPLSLRPLRPRGLAIARLLAEGRTSSQIASTLGVSRQAIWKWAHRPAILAEVSRLHDRLACAGSIKKLT